jgi:hypothetical protein
MTKTFEELWQELKVYFIAEEQFGKSGEMQSIGEAMGRELFSREALEKMHKMEETSLKENGEGI